MIKITGGKWKSRKIKVPEGLRVRPTHARLREAIFNKFQAMIEDAEIVDWFAGSGAVGLEALSRGANVVVFIERSSKVRKQLQENLNRFETNKGMIKPWGFSETLRRLPALGPFDLVFADPPYDQHWRKKFLHQVKWNELLKPEGVFCLETRRSKDQVDSKISGEYLVKIDEKNYGESCLEVFQLK